MPSLKTYDLFISHAWKYGEDYDRLINLINSAPYFKYRNYSSPQDKPLIPNGTIVPDSKILRKIENKIKPTNCVLVLAGMYANYSDWIEAEIQLADKYNIPVIGIKPWGRTFTPKFIQNNSIDVVNWQTSSIISAIRKYSK